MMNHEDYHPQCLCDVLDFISWRITVKDGFGMILQQKPLTTLRTLACDIYLLLHEADFVLKLLNLYACDESLSIYL